MKSIILFVLVLLTVTQSFSQKYKNDAFLIMNDPKLLEVVPNKIQVEILGDGFEWAEGPLWLPSENKLLFSDIPPNSIFEWTEKGGIKLYLKPSGYTGTKPLNGEPG